VPEFIDPPVGQTVKKKLFLRCLLLHLLQKKTSSFGPVTGDGLATVFTRFCATAPPFLSFDKNGGAWHVIAIEWLFCLTSTTLHPMMFPSSDDTVRRQCGGQKI
jgi:hypothetical protein